MIYVYNGIKYWIDEFHSPHDVSHNILRRWATIGGDKEAQTIWVRRPASLQVVDSFSGSRICFPYFYFGYKAPKSLYKYASLDFDGSMFGLTNKTNCTKRFESNQVQP
jgi:hypothetical protein